MSQQVMIDLEIEAYQARAQVAQLQRSLSLANATTNAALRRVTLLMAQRRILASHLVQGNRRTRLDRRDLLAFSRDILDLCKNLHDHQQAILRLGEERDHLRAELSGEKASALGTISDLQKDLDSCRDTGFRLACLLRQSRARRRSVA